MPASTPTRLSPTQATPLTAQVVDRIANGVLPVVCRPHNNTPTPTPTHKHTHTQVVDRIANDVLPVVRRSGLAGHAEYVTRSPFFGEHPVAVDMMVDVLTDRG